MELLNDWAFVVSASIGAFVIGLSRGGLAGGMGFIAVLIVAQVMSPTVAAAFILPILCLIDPFGNYVYRKHVHWPSIKVMLPGGITGIVIGAAIFYIIDENQIRLLVAALAMYMIADRIFNHHRYAKPYFLPKLVGFVLGAFSGVASTLIHAGNPPVSAYLLPMKMPRFLFIGTTAAFFTALNYIKLIPYAWLDLLDWSLLGVSLLFFPVCLAGFFTAKWIAPRISDKLFYQIVYVCVFSLGAKLGYEGLSNML